MSKKAKIILGSVGAIAVIVVLNSFLTPKKTPATSNSSNLLTSTTGMIPLPGAPSTTSADEFSKVLSSIKNITIDTSVFQNRAYIALRDYPVTLGSETVGRVNPFAPIGVDSASPVAQDTLVQTLQAGKITKATAEVGAQLTLASSAPVTVVFEYGTTDTFGSVTEPVTATKSGTVLATLNGLTPGTTYYTRAVAISGASTTTGNTTSFVTAKK